jgi:quercetin dioxygenase-like cupin family protein
MEDSHEPLKFLSSHDAAAGDRMKILNLLDTAQVATPARPDRPSMVIVSDEPAARLIVFRLAPGQSVPPHRNASLVMLTVLRGMGTVVGEVDGAATAHGCRGGDLFVFQSGELHGMSAGDEELVLLATIAPRTGSQ